MYQPIARYLEDAIAAEKSFETQLRDFADEATYAEAKTAFETHASETRQQYQLLTTRLKAIGGEPSAMKSFMAHVFNMAPKAAQTGHLAEERTTQNLIMAYSVENAEVAMYEAMIVAAEAAGDPETVGIAKTIQVQEKETAGKVWKLIGPAANDAFGKVVAAQTENAKEILIRYLQDAEAAERNFEDALASFSQSGDQQDVQALMSAMSRNARTQHERLESRLRALGGKPSLMKSILAHVISFTPVSAQAGQADSEKSTQHLMITFAAASAEMGMYEALASVAQAAGDQETLTLARQLQSEEKEDHSLAWKHLGDSARRSSEVVMRQGS